MTRSTARTVGALSACVVLAACGAPAQDARPTVRIVEAVQPSPVRALEKILPTQDELAVLGPNGMMSQRVQGGPDTLLASVGAADATPADCVSPAYRLQRVVYDAGPVQRVASQSWAGGTFDKPPVSGFFGVVQFASEADAQAFFAASADRWHRCNGQMVVAAGASSRVTDVAVEDRMVSSVVMKDSGTTVQRALGAVGDAVVDVEIADVAGPGEAGAVDAVAVANLMLQKIGVR